MLLLDVTLTTSDDRWKWKDDSQGEFTHLSMKNPYSRKVGQSGATGCPGLGGFHGRIKPKRGTDFVSDSSRSTFKSTPQFQILEESNRFQDPYEKLATMRT
ncbi:hypothetical protein L1987_73962 [Smallanthus sonchifolius]|uniref:Uncharacterized protein n=1 Tax=Smallanthus sonchifolius TaxID=185202 RepID=A0ACB9A1Q5_9ASTR|nr:hypothetical protein L1987_73962 [Smallanthus sonchifolius]